MPTRNISNSEVTCWLRCRQQYYFAFYRNLEPKVMSTPLWRGNVGHEAFQRYTEARIDGKSHDDSLRHAEEVFLQALKADSSRVDTVLEVKQLFLNYMGYHQGWPEWRLLSCEQKFDLPLNDDMNITIRYDTMVEEIRTGKILIGDYKYTYDFWTDAEHNLNGQMPKYISVMTANGIDVHGGFLEEIRTRKLAEKNKNDPRYAWKRTNYKPSINKRKNTMRQHIAAGLEIINYRNLPEEEREARTIPVLDKHGACKFCDFADVCAAKLDGGNWELMLKLGFKPNSYGYNNSQEEEGLNQL